MWREQAAPPILEIDEDGNPHPNFSKATYQQMMALQSVTIEEFMDRGEWDPDLQKFKPRQVRKIRFQLRNNVPAAVAVARLLNMIEAPAKPEPPTPLEVRLRKMTPDEREEHAKDLLRQVRERLQQPDAKREAERMGIKLSIHDD